MSRSPRQGSPGDSNAASNALTFEDALDELEKDDLVRETLGDHLFEHFLAAKREEWHDYIRHVSPWEVERYLGVY